MKLALHYKILLSLALAFSIGLMANFLTDDMSNKPVWFSYLNAVCQFFGTLFLNALKMVVIPLILTSIICGVAKIGAESNFKRLGLKTMGFYGLSGFAAVIVGLLCVNIFKPGIVNPEIRRRCSAITMLLMKISLVQQCNKQMEVGAISLKSFIEWYRLICSRLQ